MGNNLLAIWAYLAMPEPHMCGQLVGGGSGKV